MKLYAMDNDNYGLADWTDEKTEHDAASPEALARRLAIDWIDENGPSDGAIVNVIVATKPDGSDAVKYTVRLAIRCNYDIKSGRDVGQTLMDAVAEAGDYRSAELGCS